MLGEFGDNPCWLLISPAQLEFCLWSQQVDIAGGKDDKLLIYSSNAVLLFCPPCDLQWGVFSIAKVVSIKSKRCIQPIKYFNLFVLLNISNSYVADKIRLTLSSMSIKVSSEESSNNNWIKFYISSWSIVDTLNFI
jgi:hypothetical protein